MASLLLGAFLGACDNRHSFEPVVRASSTTGSGSTLDPPSGTAAVAATENRIDVSWQDNSTNESGFEVHRSPWPAAEFTQRASTGAAITAYTDVGLTPMTQYCYKVRAFRTSGKKTTYSSFSTAACATTPPPPSPPGPPEAPAWTNVSPLASTAVSVSWSDNSTSEDGFRVQRSHDGGATWGLATSAAAGAGWNTMGWTDYGRVTEEQVCYRVIAYNGAGASPPSTTDCTTPPARPNELTVTGEDLTWIDNSNVEDGYVVLLMDGGGGTEILVTLPANSTSYAGDTCEAFAWCWGYVVFATTSDGGSSDWAQVVIRSQ